MDGVIKDFYVFLENELKYLKDVQEFLEIVPKLISGNKMDGVSFGNFLEKYEMEVYRIASGKKDHLLHIATYYNVDVSEVNFNYLVGLGNREFIDLGTKIFKISNKIKMSLLKVSIYLEKFSKLNQNLQKMNQFLYQNNYASDGVEKNKERNSIFISEA